MKCSPSRLYVRHCKSGKLLTPPEERGDLPNVGQGVISKRTRRTVV